MSKFNLLAGAACALAIGFAGVAGSANAATFAYMTGSGEPWGSNSNVDAMDLAFGAGNWDHFNGFDAAILGQGYDFIYLDGGNGESTDFNSFFGSNVAGVEAYVTGGGRLMANAARWDFIPGSLGLGFGTNLLGDDSYVFASSDGTVTAAAVSAGLDSGGAGTNFGGNYFAHDIVTGVDVCYVSGSFGCVFGAVTEGLFVGSQTNSSFHSGGNPLRLRANELQFAATGTVTAIPEPGTWALMIGGFGMAGAMIRRRRSQVALAS